MDWSHSGALMHYGRYVELSDGSVSVLHLSQQEAVACVWYMNSERKPLLCTLVVCEWWKLSVCEFEQQENTNLFQKVGKSASRMFQLIQQEYSEEALGCAGLCLSGTNVWHRV
jgi:hypothetical protein